MNNVLGENLKKFRLSKKYTQEQAAQMFSVSPQSVSRWENGSTFPDVMMLPKIAEIYGVTIDDLYRENSIAYSSFAARLAAVFESTSSPADFVRADNEFGKLLKSNECTAEDLRLYGVMHQQMMLYCLEKAERIFDMAMEDSKEKEENLFYRIKRQKLLLISRTDKMQKAIEEQIEILSKKKEKAEEWILLISAYHYFGDEEKAYEIVLKAMEKFKDVAELYVYAGDVCKNLNKYDEAFRYWDKAIEIDCKCYDAKYSKAFCLEETGEYQRAYNLWCEITDELQRAGYEAEIIMPKIRAAKCKEKF